MNQERGIAIAERVVLWLFWCLFAGAVVFYRFMLVGPDHNISSFEFPRGTFGLLQYGIPLALSLAVRWLVVPCVRLPFIVLAPFLFGVATAELLMFHGIFLSPRSFNLFFITTVILMFMWIPTWRNRVEPPRPAQPSSVGAPEGR